MLNINAPLPKLEHTAQRKASPQPYLRSPQRRSPSPDYYVTQGNNVVLYLDTSQRYRDPNKAPKPIVAVFSTYYDEKSRRNHIRYNIKKIKHLEGATAAKRQNIIYDDQIRRITDFRADELRIADNIRKEMQLLLAQYEREYEVAVRAARKAALPGAVAPDAAVRLNILYLDDVKLTVRAEDTYRHRGVYFKFAQFMLSQAAERLNRTIIYDMVWLASDGKHYVHNVHFDTLHRILALNPLRRENRFATLSYATLLVICKAEKRYTRTILRRMTSLCATPASSVLSLRTVDWLVGVINGNPFIRDSDANEESNLQPIAFALLSLQTRLYHSNRNSIRQLIGLAAAHGYIKLGVLYKISQLILSGISLADNVFARKNAKIEAKYAIYRLMDHDISLSASEVLIYLLQDSKKMLLMSTFELVLNIINTNPFLHDHKAASPEQPSEVRVYCDA